MRSQRGVTLISLIIYVIIMTFVIAIISRISSSFYSNMKEFDGESESAVAYSKFNMYFLNDIKREGVNVEEVFDSYIILSYTKDEEIVKIEYSVQNKSLYRNKVKICDDVENVKITSNEEKNTVTINLKIKEYEKNTTYAIRNKRDMSNNEENTIKI